MDNLPESFQAIQLICPCLRYLGAGFQIKDPSLINPKCELPACLSEFVTTDAAFGIWVLPSNRYTPRKK
jgi:hypothetical protein